METETRVPNPYILDEAENQSFLGFQFAALIKLEKCVVFQQLRKRLSLDQHLAHTSRAAATISWM
jgi:hypothetical protein